MREEGEAEEGEGSSGRRGVMADMMRARDAWIFASRSASGPSWVRSWRPLICSSFRFRFEPGAKEPSLEGWKPALFLAGSPTDNDDWMSKSNSAMAVAAGHRSRSRGRM
jgi:hypothetical protein